MTVTDNTAGGSPPNAAFTGNGDVSPSSLSGPAPFNVVFRDTSGGDPTSWLWDFNDGSPNSTLQDPLDHVFTVPGTYLVTLTATNALGSSTATMGVTVTAVSVVDFTTNQNSGAPPLTVNFYGRTPPRVGRPRPGRSGRARAPAPARPPATRTTPRAPTRSP